MFKSIVLLFSKAIPNSGRALEPTESELYELSVKANLAVMDLGPTWKIVSASTTINHFEMGNLQTIGILLTVVAETSAA